MLIKNNYCKLSYYDYIRFFKLCCITQYDLINLKNHNLKDYIIKGLFIEKRIKKDYDIYLKKWFFIFLKYKKIEILTAINFFISLDYKNSINIKWYRPHVYVIKSNLNSIIKWWFLNKKKTKIRWHIFLGRFYALFFRSYFLLRKY